MVKIKRKKSTRSSSLKGAYDGDNSSQLSFFPLHNTVEVDESCRKGENQKLGSSPGRNFTKDETEKITWSGNKSINENHDLNPEIEVWLDTLAEVANDILRKQAAGLKKGESRGDK